jgi:putative SOS response-associated peptidase YedK
MCGRYYIPEDDDDSGFEAILEQVRSRYEGSEVMKDMKRGDIYPTNIVPVVAGPEPTLMKWGFTYSGGKSPVINARLETAEEKPMFKNAFRSHRCLIPAAYYFEWQKDGAKKNKYAIGQNAPIYMAGLYGDGSNGAPPLVVILTRPASEALAFIHDRMPVIVPEELRLAWLMHGLSAKELLDISETQLTYKAMA